MFPLRPSCPSCNEKGSTDCADSAGPCNIVPRIIKTTNIWAIPFATSSDQINEPLGMELATDMAKKYGIYGYSMTKDELYRFLYGKSPNWKFNTPRNVVVEQTVNCVINLTNSIGGVKNAMDIISPIFNSTVAFDKIPPLASYGLKFIKKSDAIYITTDCAEDQPCLVFNRYALGPLEQICKDSGCLNKFMTLLNTPLFKRLTPIAINCQKKTASTTCMWCDSNGIHTVPTMQCMNLLNFGLIYLLCPEIAAYMPKYRTVIEPEIASVLIKKGAIRLVAFKRLHSQYAGNKKRHVRGRRGINSA